MKESNDIGMLLILNQKYGAEKAVHMWTHHKDLQLLEEAQKKSDKWPRRFWYWLHCVDLLERGEKRSRERLHKGE